MSSTVCLLCLSALSAISDTHTATLVHLEVLVVVLPNTTARLHRNEITRHRQHTLRSLCPLSNTCPRGWGPLLRRRRRKRRMPVASKQAKRVNGCQCCRSSISSRSSQTAKLTSHQEKERRRLHSILSRAQKIYNQIATNSIADCVDSLHSDGHFLVQ